MISSVPFAKKILIISKITLPSRAIIKYIPYFDRSNLNLLRSTLVGLSIFTISDFIESCLMAIARYNLKGRTTLNLDFSNAVYSLIILGIIYVIYLVFKNGLKLQEESNKII